MRVSTRVFMFTQDWGGVISSFIKRKFHHTFFRRGKLMGKR